MPKTKGILYNLSVAAIFIILEVAALSMLMYSGVLQDRWISKGIHSVMAKVWGVSESARYYLSLKKTNEELVSRNFVLEQRLRAFEQKYALDIEKGKAPSGPEGCFAYIPATIVKMSGRSQHNYLIINKGSKDGVIKGAGVITDKGAIGIIDAVGKNYSYATAFTNSQMTVSARIGKEGSTGTLMWNGRSLKEATIKEIPRHIEISQGDTVFTSGYSVIFPPDIPLGTCGEKKIVNGSFYEIEVDLFEDFTTLRYVTLVVNMAKNEIEELEQNESEQ